MKLKKLKDKPFFKPALILFALVVIALLSWQRALEPFELVSFDLRFRLRPQQETSPDIVLIEIAEDSLEEIGRWPFDRAYHAQLIKALQFAEAKAIVFDIVFSEPSGSDPWLIGAAEEAGNVYFPFVFQLVADSGRPFPAASKFDASLLPPLAKAARGQGFINIITDPDGKKRWLPLFISLGGKLYPQLSLKVALDHLGLGQQDCRREGNRLRLGDKLTIPLDSQGRTLINFAGRWRGTFQHYSYHDIIRSYQQLARGETPFIDLSDLAGKICLVGLTAAGTHDLVPTPLEADYSGLGIHANFLNSLLQNKFLRRLGRAGNLLILALLLAGSLFITRRYKPLLGLYYFLGLVLIFVALSAGLFIFFSLWIDLVFPLVLITLVFFSWFFYKYFEGFKKQLLMKKELSVAQNIQKSFLPSEIPQKAYLELGVKMSIAKSVGGDLYDFFDTSTALSAGRGQQGLGLFLGDVSGKGIPAALFMVLVMAGFRFCSRQNDDPAAAFSALNDYLFGQSRSGLFVTAVYLIVPPNKNHAVFACGGHQAPLLVKKDSDSLEALSARAGCVVGVMEGVEFSREKFVFAEGDTLMLYTDGATESRNKSGQEFGEERLRTAFLRYINLAPQQIADSIHKDIYDFCGGRLEFDDTTILVARRR